MKAPDQQGRPSVQFLCQRCQKIKRAAGIYWYCTAKVEDSEDEDADYSYNCMSCGGVEVYGNEADMDSEGEEVTAPLDALDDAQALLDTWIGELDQLQMVSETVASLVFLAHVSTSRNGCDAPGLRSTLRKETKIKVLTTRNIYMAYTTQRPWNKLPSKYFSTRVRSC
ncbi:uncharacterized protein LOC125047764 isoform X1 [Penaeus chinensis]|uniref:uncharacterized protein LOC125047764 isoform X1 n=1 Tax=Penaeus chinensis TaxID=139456 RepID=UPI001FB6F4C0|nr:uncharacterized protein LOC125047764 isoform X1 [Penaeus chinensis]